MVLYDFFILHIYSLIYICWHSELIFVLSIEKEFVNSFLELLVNKEKVAAVQTLLCIVTIFYL